MARLRFAKLEGLGNDFVVVEARSADFDDAWVKRVCDRHFGVGADGVLFVEPARTPAARAAMIVRNADGSNPEMCGNGLRCVARFLADRDGDASAKLIVDTGAGALACAIAGADVTIDMGVALDLGALELDVAGRAHHLRRVTTGNPHAVTFEPYDDEAFARFGPLLATHAAFPAGTNVEMATLAADGAIDLRVWERGVGPTLACGTGACATAFAACLAGTRPFDAPVTVRLPGGPLAVTIAAGTGRVTMRGPAHRVFDGEISL